MKKLIVTTIIGTFANCFAGHVVDCVFERLNLGASLKKSGGEATMAAVPDAAAGGRAIERSLLRAGERVWFAGSGDAGAFDGDAEPGLLVHRGSSARR